MKRGEKDRDYREDGWILEGVEKQEMERGIRQSIKGNEDGRRRKRGERRKMTTPRTITKTTTKRRRKWVEDENGV